MTAALLAPETLFSCSSSVSKVTNIIASTPTHLESPRK
jgi:hypothetical protein